MTDDAERWDAIVIGSGIGGLACASLLAQLRGLRVLVLERHWRLGGFTHEFSRPGAGPWSVGLHYVGQMGEGDPVRAVMDLVTRHAVGWRALSSPFERYHFPGAIVDQPAGAGAYMESLVARWPREADALVRWFAAIEETYAWFARQLLPRRSAPADAGARRGREPAMARITTRDALHAVGVRDDALRAVLGAQWGNYGLPPGRSAFVAHAIVFRHFLAGAWFPSPSPSSIADAAVAAIEDAGGACRVSHDVQQVLLERGRAVGVRALHGAGARAEVRVHRAPLVISDAGAQATFAKLLPNALPTASHAVEALDALGTGSSAVQLFLALRGAPEALGVRGENHWMFDGWDHDVLYARRNGLPDGDVAMAYLSFPSSRTSEAAHTTAEIVAPLDHATLARWQSAPWRRRGPGYDEIKARMSDALLAFADRHVPGLRALVAVGELATPLTVERFTGHASGAIYGLAPTPARFALPCLDVPTAVPGLLLTGSDVAAAGVVGALMGAVATVGHVLGPGGMHRVLAAAQGRPITAAGARRAVGA